MGQLLVAVNGDQDLNLNISERTLRRILKDLKIVLKKNRKSILIKKDEIIRCRHKYLREIKEYRQANRPIFYLDETWINPELMLAKA